MLGARRKARVLALQALYEIDATRHDAEAVLTHLLAEANLPAQNASFTRELVNGILLNKAKIDDSIKNLAPAWPLEQLSMVDRNILRLAIFEILLNNNVPVKVAVNEAVELAKTFGSDNSPKFVNGVLGAITALVTR